MRMTKFFGSLALVAATTMSMGMMSAQAGPLHYTADCGVKELRMASGRYDINRVGAVKGNKYCEYVFRANAGQKVSADLIGSSDLYPMLYGENSQDLSEGAVTLPKTGEYTIRVTQPNAKARQSDTPKPYYLTVTIK